MTSGIQPAETDWLATKAIIMYLLSDGKDAVVVRRRYIFDVIPHVSPDDYALGTNGCNAREINLYWAIRKEDRENRPESFHLWNWITAHPSSVYLDFHCYLHNMDKDFQPYIRPVSDYQSGYLRPVVEEIDNRLISMCGGRYVGGPLTNLPSTLALQITRDFGTITYTKFHLHLNLWEAYCRALATDVLKEVISVLDKHGPIYRRMEFGDSRMPRNLQRSVYAWTSLGRKLASALGPVRTAVS